MIFGKGRTNVTRERLQNWADRFVILLPCYIKSEKKKSRSHLASLSLRKKVEQVSSKKMENMTRKQVAVSARIYMTFCAPPSFCFTESSNHFG